MTKPIILLFIIAAILSFSSCDSVNSPSNTVVDTYLHGRAAWSPDGKTIAFTSLISGQQGIYVVDTLGGTPRQILQGDGVGVTWSPDAQWLAFSKGGSIYKMKANGDSVLQLTSPANCIRPSWSPDGSKIAFIESDASGYTSLWIYDVASMTSSMVVAKGDYPSWLRSTGEIIVLDSQYDPYSGYVAYAFIAVDPIAFTARLITSFTAAADCGFCPMSPTGTDIAFGILPQNDYSEIYKYNLALQSNIQLTSDGGDYPAWSPNGSEIVYTRTQQGDGGLWIMNADGSGKRRLTKPQ